MIGTGHGQDGSRKTKPSGGEGISAPCVQFCCWGMPSFPKQGLCSQELAWIRSRKLGGWGTSLQMLHVFWKRHFQGFTSSRSTNFWISGLTRCIPLEAVPQHGASGGPHQQNNLIIRDRHWGPHQHPHRSTLCWRWWQRPLSSCDKIQPEQNPNTRWKSAGEEKDSRTQMSANVLDQHCREQCLGGCFRRGAPQDSSK